MERRWAVAAIMVLWSAAAGTLLFGPDAGQPGDFLPLGFALSAVSILLATVTGARGRGPAVAEEVWPFPPDPRPVGAPASAAQAAVMSTLGGAAGATRRARVTKWAS